MKLTWIGHSCFKIENDQCSVVLDPYSPGSVPGLLPAAAQADLVICSHEHGDHNGREQIETTGKYTISDFPMQISQIETFHDDAQGSKRGMNKITVFESGDLKVAHFGDLGCELTDAQIALLQNLSVLLIPVGGFYTIDGAQAAAIVKQLSPALVIPMHYRDPQAGYGYNEIATVEFFADLVEEAGLKVLRSPESCVDTDALPEADVIILQATNSRK